MIEGLEKSFLVTFDFLSQYRNLNLNRISSISAFAFRGLSSLTYLYAMTHEIPRIIIQGNLFAQLEFHKRALIFFLYVEVCTQTLSPRFLRQHLMAFRLWPLCIDQSWTLWTIISRVRAGILYPMPWMSSFVYFFVWPCYWFSSRRDLGQNDVVFLPSAAFSGLSSLTIL